MLLKSKILILFLIALFSSSSSFAQTSNECSGPGLHSMLGTDLSSLRKEKLEASFARAMGGAEAYAYYKGDKLSVITAAFKSNAGQADMNFYLKTRQDFLMEYHIVQNGNFFDEPDSVVLTDEKSYYHVCDGVLLSPAFGGVIDEEIFDNMKLVLDVILTEVESN